MRTSLDLVRVSFLPCILSFAVGCGDASGTKTPNELGSYARTSGQLACEKTTVHALSKQTHRTCTDVAETTVPLDASICEVEKKPLSETKFLDGSCPLGGALGVCIIETNLGSGKYWIDRTYYYYQEDPAIVCNVSSTQKWVPL